MKIRRSTNTQSSGATFFPYYSKSPYPPLGDRARGSCLLITLADQQEYLFGFQYEMIQMSFHCVLIASRRHENMIFKARNYHFEDIYFEDINWNQKLKREAGAHWKTKKGRCLIILAFEEELSVDQVRGSLLKNKEGKRLIDFGVWNRIKCWSSPRMVWIGRATRGIFLFPENYQNLI